jgi:hypothetical protein
LLIPKTFFKTALIFSAKYRPLAKYVFKSLCIQDKKRILRTFRGLKASFVNFLKVFVDFLIDQPLINIAITIRHLEMVSIGLLKPCHGDLRELTLNATLKNFCSRIIIIMMIFINV